MRLSRVAAVFACCVLSNAAAVAADRFDFKLDRQPWVEVGQRLAQASGKPIVVDARFDATDRVTISLKDVDLGGAVAAIAELVHAEYASLPGGGYVIYLPPKARPRGPASRVAIRVKHTLPSELARWLGGEVATGSTSGGPPSEPVAVEGQVAPINGRSKALAVFELPDGIQELVGYDLISSLIVLGQPEAIEDLRSLVTLLDQPVIQIRLEMSLWRLAPDGERALAELLAKRSAATGPAHLADVLAVPVAQQETEPLLVAGRAERVMRTEGTTANGQQFMVQFAHRDGTPGPLLDQLILVPRVTGEPGQEAITVAIIVQRDGDGPATAEPPDGLVSVLRLHPNEMALIRAPGTTADDGSPLIAVVRATVVADPPAER